MEQIIKAKLINELTFEHAYKNIRQCRLWC